MSLVAQLQGADEELNASAPRPFPVPLGRLATVVAGALSGMERGDWWVPGLRERVGGVLREVPLARLVDGLAGARPYRIAPPSPSPALRALHAVGIALAQRRPTIVHLGIGSVADGAFAEALNLAALFRAPVVFVVAVDPLCGSAEAPSPVGRQSAASPSALAEAYGIPARVVGASSVEAVRSAVHLARSERGPSLIEACWD